MCKVDEVLIMDSKQWKSIEFNKSWVIEHIRSPPFYIPELAFIAYANHELAGYLMFSKLIIRENGIPPNSICMRTYGFLSRDWFCSACGNSRGKKKKRYWHMS
jgi:hypothetical protein